MGTPAWSAGTVGLPLFESIEMLGRARTLARMDAATAKLTPVS
jgi:glutamyl-tRNA synthetase